MLKNKIEQLINNGANPNEQVYMFNWDEHITEEIIDIQLGYGANSASKDKYYIT